VKIVSISDIHVSDENRKRQIDLPEGDLLIVAGDLTAIGTLAQLQAFNRYLESQSGKFTYKPLVIAGNHDFVLESNREEAVRSLTAATYLQDEFIEIDGIKFYGSPWTPPFYDWAFMKGGPEARERWDLIPEGLDVLITHGPPLNILDFCGTHVGCAELLDVVTNELSSPPQFHVFGHIHEGYGDYINKNTQFFNVAICNERYIAVHPATVFEVMPQRK
jgi:Icc-related predicted phosphoesterase